MFAFLLICGILCAAIGGELFVRGAVGIASWARIPAGVVGATVAAFATSSPELSVSIISANQKKPEIALGDALGSNVTNICLVLAIAILILPIKTSPSEIKRDLPFAFMAPVLVGLLAFDGKLSRIDGLALLVFFLTWLTLTVVQTMKARSDVVEVLGEKKIFQSVFNGIVGLAFLVLAGRFIVSSAKDIGDALGWDPFIVGATLVAFGTSTPELATTIISRVRGHDDIGVGTVIGSNIFNTLWIVGIAALIYPINIVRTELLIGVAMSVLAIAFLIPGKDFVFKRYRGALLVCLYVGYVGAMILIS